MEYEQIRYKLDNSPAIKLLRSRNAALILSFLYKQFKVTQPVSIAQVELETKLSDYLEFLQDIEAGHEFQSPKEYIKKWCDEQLLRKTFDSSDQPILMLTPAAEKAIALLEDLNQRVEFVGTESRFLQIFSLLKEISDRSTTDIETRITQLEQDRDRIQQEIDRIRQTGEIDRYNRTQLQERFQLANQMTQLLIADFKTVEENFRSLTRTVQEAQLQKDTRKGSVVSRVLDVDRKLKDSDQGRSFYAFWNFLMSNSKRQELKSLIQTVYTLEELQPFVQDYKSLRKIERSLLDAGQYIVESNHSLAEKLRQMLDERSLRENRRVAELMNEVKSLALQVSRQAPPEGDFWLLEGSPAVNLAIARPLHPLEETENPTFLLSLDNLPEVSLDEEMAELYRQFYVDEALLRQRIEQTLEYREEITLTELLQIYRVTQGLPEIVAYLGIASESDRHSINPHIIETMSITSLEPEKQFQLTLPQIIFRR